MLDTFSGSISAICSSSPVGSCFKLITSLTDENVGGTVGAVVGAIVGAVV